MDYIVFGNDDVKLQKSRNLLADEMEIYETGIDDVDAKIFAEYFIKEFGQSYHAKGLSFEEALRAKRVLRNGQLTLAGSFFGNDISSNRYSNKPNDFKGTIPDLFEQYIRFFTNNLH